MTMPRARILIVVAGVVIALAAIGYGAKVWLELDARPNLPVTVDGLRVLSVSSVLTARANGQLKDQPVAVGGYWSGSTIAHSCVPPPQGLEPGELEIACHDGEYGITELNEPMIKIEKPSQFKLAVGPHLTPYISNEVVGLDRLQLMPVNGQPYPPVPIIVIGHFDDPRADDCRPEARQLCLDRLVIERIAYFDPTAVVLPLPTMAPTPFASGEEPAPLFGPADCAGDVEYSFAGWTTLADQGIDRGDVHENAYVMITAEAVPLNEWQGPYGAKARLWGRQICFRWIWEGAGSGSMNLELVPGSTFKELQDGTHVEWNP